MGCGASRVPPDYVQVKTKSGATIVVHKDTVKTPQQRQAGAAKAKGDKAAAAAPPPPPPEPDVPVVVTVPAALPNGCGCAKCTAAALAAAALKDGGAADAPAVCRLGITLRGLRRMRTRLVEFFGAERYPSVSTATVNAEWVQVVTREQRVRLAEAAQLVEPEDVGVPLYFVSHAWKNSFELLLRGIEAFLASAAEDTRVWVDIIAVNQHADSGQQGGDVGAFADVVHASSAGTLVVMDLSSCNPATRAWCVYEWAHTLADHGPDGLHMAGLGPDEVGQLVGSLDVEAAECFKEEDKAFIMSNVVQHHGSPQAFNTKLKLQLMLEPLSYRVDLRRLQQRAAASGSPSPSSNPTSASAPAPAPAADAEPTAPEAPPPVPPEAAPASASAPASAAASASGASNVTGADAGWDWEPVRRWLSPESAAASRVLVVCGGAGQGKSTISALLCRDPDAGGFGHLVAAHHFLKYNDTRRLEPVRIIKSLAFQLAARLPAFSEALLKLDVASIARATSEPDNVFRSLLQQPLEALPPEQRPPHGLVLLLDALDEADPLELQVQQTAATASATPAAAAAAAAAAPAPTAAAAGGKSGGGGGAGAGGAAAAEMGKDKSNSSGSGKGGVYPTVCGNGALQLLTTLLEGLPRWVRFVLTTRPDAAAGQVLPCLRRVFGAQGVTELTPSDLRKRLAPGAGGPSAAAAAAAAAPAGGATAAAASGGGGGASGGLLVYHTALSALHSAGACLTLPRAPKLEDLYDLFGKIFRAAFDALGSGGGVASGEGEGGGGDGGGGGEEEAGLRRQRVVDLLAVTVAAREPLSQSLLQQMGLGGCVPHLPGHPTLFFVDEHHLYTLHKSLADWLVDSRHSGAFAADATRGHSLLGLHLASNWKAAGDKCMPYTLKHVVHHLAAAVSGGATAAATEAPSSQPDGGGGGGGSAAATASLSAAVAAALDELLTDFTFIAAASKAGHMPGVIAALGSMRPGSHTALSYDVRRWLHMQQQALGASLYVPVEGFIRMALTAAPVSCPLHAVAARASGQGWRTTHVGPREQSVWSKCKSMLPGHWARVEDVAFSPDGSQVVSASADKDLKVFSAATGACLATLKGHESGVCCVAWSPDGRTIASGGLDSAIRLWDAATGQCEHVLTGHNGGAVVALAASACGSLLASAGQDDTVRLWALTGDKKNSCTKVWKVYQGDRGPSCLALSHDAQQLAVGTYGGVTMIYDVRRGNCHTRLNPSSDDHAPKFSVLSVAFGPKDYTLVTASEDRMLRFWDPPSAAPGTPDAFWKRASRIVAHTSDIRAVRFSPDGTKVATGSDDFSAAIWDVKTEKCVSRLRGHQSCVKGLAWSPDGSLLASCGDDQTVRLWDTSPQGFTEEPADQIFSITAVAWSPDRAAVACVGESKDLIVRNPRTGGTVRKLTGHTEYLTCVAWSPDGAHIATGGRDKSIRIWSWSRKTCVKTLSAAHPRQVLCVAWDPTDPERLVSSGGGDDGIVKAWNVKSGECTATLETRVHEKTGLGCDVVDLAFASAPAAAGPAGSGTSTSGGGGGGGDTGSGGSGRGGGALLATCSTGDKSIRLWDLASCECVATFDVFLPHRLAWAPDGSQLAVAACNGVVVWDVALGAVIASHDATKANRVSWAPDGSLLAVHDEDGVSLRDPETGELRARLEGHSRSVTAVAWAPKGGEGEGEGDGQGKDCKLVLLTGSEDQTVRVWERLEG